MRGVPLIEAGESRKVELDVCVVAELRNGKIHKAREYFDSATMSRQLGLDPQRLAALFEGLGAKAETDKTKPGQSAEDIVKVPSRRWLELRVA